MADECRPIANSILVASLCAKSKRASIPCGSHHVRRDDKCVSVRAPDNASLASSPLGMRTAFVCTVGVQGPAVSETNTDTAILRAQRSLESDTSSAVVQVNSLVCDRNSSIWHD